GAPVIGGVVVDVLRAQSSINGIAHRPRTPDHLPILNGPPYRGIVRGRRPVGRVPGWSARSTRARCDADVGFSIRAGHHGPLKIRPVGLPTGIGKGTAIRSDGFKVNVMNADVGPIFDEDPGARALD